MRTIRTPFVLPEIWIQSWERGYRELSLSDLRGQADLNALATDAGTQLAGHFWSTSPEALRGHQRFTQLRAFELTEQRAAIWLAPWRARSLLSGIGFADRASKTDREAMALSDARASIAIVPLRR